MPGDIISHKCTKNHDQMMYGSWIWCATDRWMDGHMDGKSDIYRWVPHLKIIRCMSISNFHHFIAKYKIINYKNYEYIKYDW